MSYHVREIERHTYGTFGKVREEFQEAQDANEQGNPVMVLLELSDMVGAIQGFLEAEQLTGLRNDQQYEVCTDPSGFAMLELKYVLLEDAHKLLREKGHLMGRRAGKMIQAMDDFLVAVNDFAGNYNMHLGHLRKMTDATKSAFMDGTRQGTVSELHMVQVKNPGLLLGPQLMSYSPSTGWRLPEVDGGGPCDANGTPTAGFDREGYETQQMADAIYKCAENANTMYRANGDDLETAAMLSGRQLTIEELKEKYKDFHAKVVTPAAGTKLDPRGAGPYKTAEELERDRLNAELDRQIHSHPYGPSRSPEGY